MTERGVDASGTSAERVHQQIGGIIRRDVRAHDHDEALDRA